MSVYRLLAPAPPYLHREAQSPLLEDGDRWSDSVQLDLCDCQVSSIRIVGAYLSFVFLHARRC